MTSAVAGGVHLEYDVFGGGEPVLFVQGLGYGRRGWGPAPALVAEAFQVVAYDSRGFGDSDVPPGPYTTLLLAADAVAVLDAAGLESAHVLGISLGGMVAQELALAYPERVRKLVLCSTTPGGAGSLAMPERTVALMAEAQQLAPEEALRRFVVNALSPAAPQSLVEEIVAHRIAHPPDPAGWLALAAAGAAHDALARLDRIAAPTLVVYGTEDNVVDPRNAQLLADGIPGATSVALQGAGHLPPWERPAEFAALVTEFLA